MGRDHRPNRSRALFRSRLRASRSQYLAVLHPERHCAITAAATIRPPGPVRRHCRWRPLRHGPRLPGAAPLLRRVLLLQRRLRDLWRANAFIHLLAAAIVAVGAPLLPACIMRPGVRGRPWTMARRAAQREKRLAIGARKGLAA